MALSTGHYTSYRFSTSISPLASSYCREQPFRRLDRRSRLANQAEAFMSKSKRIVGMGLGVVALSLAFWSSPAALEVPARAQEKRPQGVDAFGDPLPRGAILRLGTTRFRSLGPTYAAALSPDGKLAVTASDDHLFFWDTATGKELRRSHNPGAGGVFSLSFTPDGKRLCAGSTGGPVTLWDAATGKLLRAFRAKDRFNTQAAISPDGKVVAATGSPNPPVGGGQPASDPITLW